MNSKRQNILTSKSQNNARQRDVSDLDILTFGRFDVCSNPDFTRRVMGRLGYMRVSKSRARRDRIRRWANRAGLMLAVAVAIGFAYRSYESSNQVRRPASLTIPAAISNDVQQQQHRLENVIRSIRSVVPIQPRLTPIDVPQQREPEPQQIEGDFDQPQSSPFRWV
jgi:hypothetical protein